MYKKQNTVIHIFCLGFSLPIFQISPTLHHNSYTFDCSFKTECNSVEIRNKKCSLGGVCITLEGIWVTENRKERRKKVVQKWVPRLIRENWRIVPDEAWDDSNTIVKLHNHTLKMARLEKMSSHNWTRLNIRDRFLIFCQHWLGDSPYWQIGGESHLEPYDLR